MLFSSPGKIGEAPTDLPPGRSRIKEMGENFSCFGKQNCEAGVCIFNATFLEMIVNIWKSIYLNCGRNNE